VAADNTPVPAGSPTWLVILLAVIATVGTIMTAAIPKLADRRRSKNDADIKAAKAEKPATETAPERADTALAIVQAAMIDLQKQRDRLQRAAERQHYRIGELEDEVREARATIAAMQTRRRRPGA
jgi:chromosome segregation ATPase